MKTTFGEAFRMSWVMLKDAKADHQERIDNDLSHAKAEGELLDHLIETMLAIKNGYDNIWDQNIKVHGYEENVPCEKCGKVTRVLWNITEAHNYEKAYYLNGRAFETGFEGLEFVCCDCAHEFINLEGGE